MKKSLIKIHKNDLHNYISAKIDFNYKKKLKELDKKVSIQNDFIKININYDNNDKKNKFNDINNNSIKDNSISGSYLSSSNLSFPDSFKKKVSYYLEDLIILINRKLVNNIGSKNLFPLSNFLFMLNLKIPQYNDKINSIAFKSVYLDFF